MICWCTNLNYLLIFFICQLLNEIILSKNLFIFIQDRQKSHLNIQSIQTRFNNYFIIYERLPISTDLRTSFFPTCVDFDQMNAYIKCIDCFQIKCTFFSNWVIFKVIYEKLDYGLYSNITLFNTAEHAISKKKETQKDALSIF